MSDSDYALALKLQEELNKTEKFVNYVASSSSPYNRKERENVPPNSSVIDSSWEYLDPTPDVYAMFQQFNKRFFWGKLDSVELKWSPRMTTCAGICVYEGRGGFCSVRLSAPLLKLRPRKDLVETMLHEMIHAYLFVTHNNRDRDGHGPEFHKHMYRINKEAGTNITVYHTFHDEVEVYKQHWWRCDGPCQKRPPYFGMLRRASNRAPGPNDFWWSEHQSKCGGTYIKIKEPEGYADKKAKKMSSKSEGKAKPKSSNQKDITNFFPSNGKGKNLTSSSGSSSSSGKFATSSNVKHKGPSQGTENVPRNGVAPNVMGFNDLTKRAGGQDNNSKSNNKNTGAVKKNFTGGALMNKGTGTLVVTAKGSKTSDKKSETENNKVSVKTNNISVFSGKGNVLGGSSASTIKPLEEKPWLARFNNASQGKPRETMEDRKMSNKARATTLDEFSSKKGKHSKDSDIACDVIEVLSSPETEKRPKTMSCPICNESVEELCFNKHIDSCVKCVFESDETIVSCPTCSKDISKSELDEHLDTCIQYIFESSQNFDFVVDDDDNDTECDSSAPGCHSDPPDSRYPCPCCMQLIHENLMNQHLDECLSVNFLKEHKDD